MPFNVTSAKSGERCRVVWGRHMSKEGKKLIEAVKEAVEAAKCDHDLIRQPHLGEMQRFYCRKCGATIWEPPNGR